MKYNKPTLEVLGDAVRVIQGGKGAMLQDGTTPPIPFTNNPVPPAYELDE